MPADLFQFEEFELDRVAFELRRNGESVRLERLPFELLSLLVERRGQLVTREEIIEHVWGKGVFHDTEHGINTAVRKIRVALQDNSDSPRFVVTVPAKGYRFVATVEKFGPGAEAGASSAAQQHEPVPGTESRQGPWGRIVIPVLVFLSVIGLAAFFHFHRVRAISEKDTVVIADFANSAGDPVFDETLKQALSVELSQSPFLNILSDEKMSEALRMMGHPADERVNEKTAMEICRRTQSAAVLIGSIAILGKEYVIGLSAVSCGTGDILAKEQLLANSKEDVLKAVDRAATKLRGSLGESLGTIRKFDTPVEQATTPSLEALQAYSLGKKHVMAGNMSAAVSAFRTAVQIDPTFAVAYAILGSTYSNLGELDLAAEYTKKAYEFRERVTQRERFYIESHYHMFVTGSVEKGRDALEMWAQLYPRDVAAAFNLGAMYGNIGQFDKALEEGQEVVSLDPGSALNYETLAYYYLSLNRLAEAQAAVTEARAINPDSHELHITSYLLAFLQNDSSGMQQELAWAAGKHGIENILIASEANTAAYFGRLKAARELSRRAIISAQQAGEMEAAANYLAESALRESLFGNLEEGRKRAKAALAESKNVKVMFLASLALALAADTANAEKAANELAAAHPEDSIMQYSYLPTIRAQFSLNKRAAAEAIQALEAAAPYELGDEGRLNPIYLRGRAYLAAGRGAEAATEFQKILDHRGVVLMFPIGSLAHLEIGRAYALAGKKDKARKAYQNFLALWKDADPDIPILKEAKAEYAKLQ